MSKMPFNFESLSVSVIGIFPVLVFRVIDVEECIAPINTGSPLLLKLSPFWRRLALIAYVALTVGGVNKRCEQLLSRLTCLRGCSFRRCVALARGGVL